MKSDHNIVVVDDDPDLLASLVQLLELEGHKVSAFDNVEAALKHLTADFNGVVLLDINMPGTSGEDALTQLMSMDSNLPVIHITGHGDIPMAVRALKNGAYGFFTKPLQTEELFRDIQKAQAARFVEIERRKLARQLELRDDLIDVVVGTSRNMVTLRQQILKIGSSNVDVLVQGETGTGKEVAARALVKVSARSEGPLIAINCGNISQTRTDEELFGIELVDNSGHTTIRAGRFERANGGTLLLDEIESMPLTTQVGLLRVLQERTVERVNGSQEIPLDIRVIATTKVDLRRMATEGTFREDLYYRLNGMSLNIPPLRERGADPVILFERFLQQAQQEGEAAGVPALEAVTPSLMSDLLSHDWPGNVRELQHAAERFAAGLSIFSADENQTIRSDSLSVRVASFEKDLIEATLAHHKGSIKRTMLELDVPRKTLYDKMTKYGINKEKYVST
ncbi:MAG: sigma-54 dependent transcriptional regulator [Granulosicoccus sp.]|nr:sigma-54 dependent transcriptional regulator [Granulosicoccus sp.]